MHYSKYSSKTESDDDETGESRAKNGKSFIRNLNQKVYADGDIGLAERIQRNVHYQERNVGGIDNL
jgi:hypothetical protein